MLIEKLLKVALLGSTWVMYLLLLLSVVSITTMIERWVFFRRRTDDVDELGEQLIALLQRGDRHGAAERLKKSRSVEAAVLLPALRYLDGSPDAVDDAVQSQLLRERRDMERGMTYMGTLGNNAPFVGLLGTVIGIVQAFHELERAGLGGSASADIMGAISEALVATAIGAAGGSITSVDLVAIEHVGLHEQHGRAELVLELLLDRAAGQRIDLGDGDRGSFTRERTGDAAADALPAAGDDGRLPVEPAHPSFSFPKGQKSAPRIRALVGTPVPAVTRTCSTSSTWLTDVPRT